MSTTASAPAASAVRSTVPAFPGSRTWASTATSFGRAASTSANGVSMKRQRATMPCGVTVSQIPAITSSVAVSTGSPSASADSTIPACRSAASTVAYTSTTTCSPEPGSRPYATASRTACGPSARKRRSLPRWLRLASLRAAMTRGERREVSRGVSVLGMVSSLYWRLCGDAAR